MVYGRLKFIMKGRYYHKPPETKKAEVGLVVGDLPWFGFGLGWVGLGWVGFGLVLVWFGFGFGWGIGGGKLSWLAG